MRKTTKAILGVVSGVALTIGTAAAAPPNPPDTNSSKVTKEAPATKVKKLPGSESKIKEGTKPGNQADKSLKSMKVKENAKPGQKQAQDTLKPGKTGTAAQQSGNR
jgi:hypothetical protein